MGFFIYYFTSPKIFTSPKVFCCCLSFVNVFDWHLWFSLAPPPDWILGPIRADMQIIIMVCEESRFGCSSRAYQKSVWKSDQEITGSISFNSIMRTILELAQKCTCFWRSNMFTGTTLLSWPRSRPHDVTQFLEKVCHDDVKQILPGKSVTSWPRCTDQCLSAGDVFFTNTPLWEDVVWKVLTYEIGIYAVFCWFLTRCLISVNWNFKGHLPGICTVYHPSVIIQW